MKRTGVINSNLIPLSECHTYFIGDTNCWLNDEKYILLKGSQLKIHTIETGEKDIFLLCDSHGIVFDNPLAFPVLASFNNKIFYTYNEQIIYITDANRIDDSVDIVHTTQRESLDRITKLVPRENVIYSLDNSSMVRINDIRSHRHEEAIFPHSTEMVLDIDINKDGNLLLFTFNSDNKGAGIVDLRMPTKEVEIITHFCEPITHASWSKDSNIVYLTQKHAIKTFNMHQRYEKYEEYRSKQILCHHNNRERRPKPLVNIKKRKTITSEHTFCCNLEKTFSRGSKDIVVTSNPVTYSNQYNTSFLRVEKRNGYNNYLTYEEEFFLNQVNNRKRKWSMEYSYNQTLYMSPNGKYLSILVNIDQFKTVIFFIDLESEHEVDVPTYSKEIEDTLNRLSYYPTHSTEGLGTSLVSFLI
jgi:hypothetical protein